MNRKPTKIWVLLMVIFVVQLFFYTWCRVQYVNVGYEIANNYGEFQELKALQNNLKIELERLRSPDRIARIAKEKIGLRNPKSEQIIVIH